MLEELKRRSMSCNATTTRSRSPSAGSLPYTRKSRSRRCWLGCLWIKRISLMGSISSSSSPALEETTSVIDRMKSMLNEKPVKMAHMLKVAKWINDSTREEKVTMFDVGILQTICELIEETSMCDTRKNCKTEKKKNRRFSTNNNGKGTGYGHGSTRSKWDIEKTIEERLAREEQLTWFLNALNAYIVGWPFVDPGNIKPADLSHMTDPIVKMIGESGVIKILEYNFRNDSILDVSDHMELYQSLMETTLCLAAVPTMVPYLVKPYIPSAKSISKELIPRFNENLSTYKKKWSANLGNMDFRLMDFIVKVDAYTTSILTASRVYEETLPPEQRLKTAETVETVAPAIPEEKEPEEPVKKSADDIYSEMLKPHQMQIHRFVGEYNKLAVPFTYKKEARNTNPFAASHRERTKRIAKELASMTNALPLNASNSIFVCVDESRCDIIKVLISGPDDTPYANGLFEFDIFFPSGYPLSPPKCSFLTTGYGNVRFNPNLYNDGKICLSILGTWEGRPEEKWTPYCSLMQVLVSIQGLIFTKDPYFNEPGFEKYQGTEKGNDYSKRYNLQIEHATLNYAIRDMYNNPPEHFKEVIQKHFWLKRQAVIDKAKSWLASMKSEAMENEKNPKKKESLTFESVYNPIHQERSVLQLIADFGVMKPPPITATPV